MESIKKIVIYEAVVSEIIKYIKSNNLKNGDRIPTEREMSYLLNVSRNSIREALKILEANYIITIKHGSGIYVNSFNSLEFSLYETSNEQKNVLLNIKQLAEARQMIETFCSIEVSKIITKEQLNTLFEYEEYENMLISSDNITDINKVYPGFGLELMITDIFGNPFIKNNHKRMEDLWRKQLSLINSVPFPLELRHDDHIEIITSIKNKNKNKIEKAVEKHIKRTVTAIDRLLS